MPHMQHPLALVADIGGTNARVALARGPEVLPETVRRYRNAEHSGLPAILQRFLAETGGERPTAACVAAAGPVRDGVARMLNLGWTVDRAEIARATGAQVVAVLNDLQAQGHALAHLAPDALQEVHAGAEHVAAGAARLAVGIGTGFNCAPVISSGALTVVAASEAGHVTLPARGAADRALQDALIARHGFPAVEEALSGRGLEFLYRHHAEGREMDAGAVMDALEAGDPYAEAAVAQFAALLGAVVGDLALVHLPYGGIYLTGGVARAVAPALARFDFNHAFCDKGRLAAFMAQFSVHVVQDDYAALTGSASHLAERLMLG